VDEEVFVHFRAVAEAARLPLCIYNNPGTTRFAFSPALLSRLAAVETIGAVKMPLPGDGDFAAELKTLRATLPRDFKIGYSGDWGCAAAMRAGADSFFSVAAGLLPTAMRTLIQAARSGDAEADARFAALWSLFREFGSLRVVYAAGRRLGLIKTDPPRPLLPLPDAAWARVDAALDALSLSPV